VSFVPLPPRGLHEILAALSPEAAVGWRTGASLVVNPSGAFVLVPGGDDLAEAADRAHNLAGRARVALARHLAWVPFIDAAVVSPHGAHAELPAIVVAPDLVAELVSQGPPVIDLPAIAVIRGLLTAGTLDGWREGVGPDAVKIDLCDTTPPTLQGEPVNPTPGPPITALH
jgi:hypothetical protein